VTFVPIIAHEEFGLSMESRRLVVMGQGYVGLPLALRAAETGFSVTGYDPHEPTVKTLNAGHSHIDDISDREVAEALTSGYIASGDPAVLQDADVIVVCVPTPLSEAGGPDLTAVESAADTIGQHVRPGTLVVLESTTYPGTTEEQFAPRVLAAGHSVDDVLIAFSPERIDPGNPTYGVRNTPKVVGGLTPEATAAAKAFYGAFIDTIVEARGAKEAEMAKLLENTFRHVNIALVNEMVRFSDELGIDLWDAIACAETKPFGYMAFRPGPGVGGHCIPVDPSYLSHRVRALLGYSFRMVELAEEINSAAPVYVADRLARSLNERALPVNGSTILLVGVTYKANIADQRESPAVPLARRLIDMGAIVRYHDPYVDSWVVEAKSGVREFTSEASLLDAAKDSDAVILLQPHREYDLNDLARASNLLLDTRGIAPEVEGVERL
jgi:UDP-N-acetyl-D-glucosamine dehydrogenase